MQGAVSLSAEANKVQRVCAKCGATVFADSPRGFCSVCLFKTGLGQLEGDCSGEQEQSRIQGVGVTANILSKVTLDGSIRLLAFFPNTELADAVPVCVCHDPEDFL
jgi:hypothetical protein